MRAVTAAAAWVLVSALLGCSRQGTAAANPSGSGAAAPADANDFVLREDTRGVSIAVAQSQRLTDYLAVPGRIQADPTNVVRVYPPVSGRLVAVQVRPADHVAQGQVLAILASSDVAAARAGYRQAQADAAVKRQALERSRLLYEHHVTALREYEQAQADAAMSAAALESAASRLALLGVDTADASDQIAIRAPRAGVVVDLGAAPGEYAKSLDNANPLCTIADLRTVWAVGDVYEKDLASLQIGDSAEVTANAYPDERRRGRITAIASTVDSTTRTLKVRVVLANAGLRLKPDMFATIRVIRAVRSAVVVPLSAVLREGTSAYLFVQTSSHHFARRSVTLGRDTERGQVEVTSGLAPGDTIVVEGSELLRATATSS